VIDNRYLAGLAAGIPISLVCLAYALLRRDAVVEAFTSGGGGTMSTGTATALAIAAAVCIGPGLGLAAAVVYGLIGAQQQYALLAFGLATLMSVAALVSRTPLMIEKIALNYVVALTLGLLMPWLLKS
jgi:hypothetical protein